VVVGILLLLGGGFFVRHRYKTDKQTRTMLNELFDDGRQSLHDGDDAPQYLTKLQSDSSTWLIDESLIVIGKVIGRGSSATVFAGSYSEEKVAIKRIFAINESRNSSSRREKQRQQAANRIQVVLEREAGLLAKLHHPNIVRFFGICVSKNMFLIVTELCDISLWDLILDVKKKRLGKLTEVDGLKAKKQKEQKKKEQEAKVRKLLSNTSKITERISPPSARQRDPEGGSAIEMNGSVTSLSNGTNSPSTSQSGDYDALDDIGSAEGLIVGDAYASSAVKVDVAEPLPERAASGLTYLSFLQIAKSIANGARFLNSKGIAHRDIKPGNILIKKSNVELMPKICDFGLSRILNQVAVPPLNPLNTHKLHLYVSLSFSSICPPVPTPSLPTPILKIFHIVLSFLHPSTSVPYAAWAADRHDSSNWDSGIHGARDDLRG
jgi:serine/threonine protein kinase